MSDNQELAVNCCECGGEYMMTWQAHKYNQQGFNQKYPSDNEIVAAVAGELMSTAVRVSMCAVADVFVMYHAHVSELECHIFVDGWKHTNRRVDLPQECRASIYLDRDGAVEALTDLIQRVEALGEVSA